VKGHFFCTACGLCCMHHVGPLCTSEPEYDCAWERMGFDLRTVVRSAGAGHIPRYITGTTCPYCRINRPLMLDMKKPPMTFTEGMWERARSTQLPF
jgi:hypothetical protein